MYVFDIYGSFKTRISYFNLTHINVIGKTMVGMDQDQLLFYTFGTLNEKKLKLAALTSNGFKKIIIRNRHLYLLFDDEIVHYTY
jgi:hypothetical protein